MPFFFTTETCCLFFSNPPLQLHCASHARRIEQCPQTVHGSVRASAPAPSASPGPISQHGAFRCPGLPASACLPPCQRGSGTQNRRRGGTRAWRLPQAALLQRYAGAWHIATLAIPSAQGLGSGALASHPAEHVLCCDACGSSSSSSCCCCLAGCSASALPALAARAGAGVPGFRATAGAHWRQAPMAVI